MPHNTHPLATQIRRLGHAGLVPFVLLALTVWVLTDIDLQVWAAMAMASYAALVISFLGGIYWGALWAAPKPLPNLLWWGVAPSLLAWPGVLMPPHAGLVWLAAMLVACYLVDRKFYPALGLGHWLRLRFQLSAVAALSCLVAAGAI
jgi:hypothetical protein